MSTPDIFPAVGAIQDTEWRTVREDDVDCGVRRDWVGGLGVWGGGGIGSVLGRGIEAVDMAGIGKGPAAELGLVGGCVDLFYLFYS